MKKLILILFAPILLNSVYAQTFYNSGAAVTVQTGATLYVDGNTDLENGGSFSNAGLIQLRGNWTNNASTSALAGTGKVLFFNGSNSFIKGNFGTTFHNLELNTGLVTNQRASTVNNNLSFVKGMFNATATVTLGTTATVTNEANGKYTIGTLQTTRSVAATNTFGGMGLSLNPNGTNLGNVTLVRKAGTGSAYGNIPTANPNSINRTWTVTAANAHTNSNLTFNWLSDDDNAVALGDAALWRTDNNGTSWTELTKGNLSAHSVTVNGATTVTQFTVGGSSNVTKAVVFTPSIFSESANNDGSIVTVSTIKLYGSETFTGANGTFDPAKYSITGVPAGLTPVLTRKSSTELSLSFTGNATASAAANNTNITVAFGNGAFTGGNASSVSGSTRNDIQMAFTDAKPEFRIVGVSTAPIASGSTIDLGKFTPTTSVPTMDIIIEAKNAGTGIWTVPAGIPALSGTNLPEFEVVSGLPNELGINQTGRITIRFKPTSNALKQLGVGISTDADPNPELNFTLKVESTSPAGAADMEISYNGIVVSNSASVFLGTLLTNDFTNDFTATFVLKNKGSGNWVSTEPNFLVINDPQFTVGGLVGLTNNQLPGGQSATFTVRFKAQNYGLKSVPVSANFAGDATPELTFTAQIDTDQIPVTLPPVVTEPLEPSGPTTVNVPIGTQTLTLVDGDAPIQLGEQFKVGQPFVVGLPLINVFPNATFGVIGQTTQVIPQKAGTYTLTFVNQGLRTFQVTITVGKGEQILTPSELKPLTPITLTSTPFVPDFGIGNLTYEIIEGGNIATIVDGKLVPTGNAVGTVKMRVCKAETDDLLKSNCEEVTLVVGKGSQTITFGTIPSRVFKQGETFEISATSTSGLPIVFTPLTDNISISGNTVTVLKAGIAEIQATQTGNDLYESATGITQVFFINKATQTIDFAEIAAKLATDGAFSLSASASSGLPVTFELVSGEGIVALNGSTITMVGGSGTVQIRAVQAGDVNFLPATAVVRTFTVRPVLVLNSVSLRVEDYTLLLEFEAIGILRNDNMLVEVSDSTGSFENTPNNGWYSVIDIREGRARVDVPVNVVQSNAYRIRLKGRFVNVISNELPVEVLFPKPNTSWVKREGTILCVTQEAEAYQWYVRNEAGEWEVIAGATERCLDMESTFGNEYKMVSVRGFRGNRPGDYSTGYGYRPLQAEVLANEAEIIDELRIYPNPASGQFSVELTMKKSGKVSMKLVDVLGKEIYPKSFENMPIRFVEHYNIEALPNGIYFLHIDTEQGTIVRKIIKE